MVPTLCAREGKGETAQETNRSGEGNPQSVAGLRVRARKPGGGGGEGNFQSEGSNTIEFWKKS